MWALCDEFAEQKIMFGSSDIRKPVEKSEKEFSPSARIAHEKQNVFPNGKNDVCCLRVWEMSGFGRSMKERITKDVRYQEWTEVTLDRVGTRSRVISVFILIHSVVLNVSSFCIWTVTFPRAFWTYGKNIRGMRTSAPWRCSLCSFALCQAVFWHSVSSMYYGTVSGSYLCAPWKAL